MATHLASLSALARPAAPSRSARPRTLRFARLRPLVAASPARPRLNGAFTARAGSDEAHTGEPDRRAVDKSEWIEAEAFGPVSAYCSATLAACTPETPIGDIMHHFDEFTGLPVLDDQGCPVGVVSVKDVAAYLQQYGEDASRLSMPVSAVMSTPAVCIRSTARIAYAAGLMLQQCVTSS